MASKLFKHNGRDERVDIETHYINYFFDYGDGKRIMRNDPYWVRYYAYWNWVMRRKDWKTFSISYVVPVVKGMGDRIGEEKPLIEVDAGLRKIGGDLSFERSIHASYLFPEHYNGHLKRIPLYWDSYYLMRKSWKTTSIHHLNYLLAQQGFRCRSIT